MENTRFSFISPRNQIPYYNPNTQGVQKKLVTCPHCKTQSQTTGKVKNSWYVLCRCGLYIQTCESADDYRD